MLEGRHYPQLNAEGKRELTYLSKDKRVRVLAFSKIMTKVRSVNGQYF